MDLQGRFRRYAYLPHRFARHGIQIRLLRVLFLYSCLHLHLHYSRVHSFSSPSSINNITKCRLQQQALSAQSQPQEKQQTPTIRNPLTKRKISLRGKVYQDFLRQGQWVQHQGTLQPLDVDLLGHYQKQGEDLEEDQCQDVSHYHNKMDSLTLITEDDPWYPIAPHLLTAATTSSSSEQQQEQPNDLLFVHKPSGLHCVPPRDVTQSSLAAMVAKRYGNKAKPCHRLDRDTSGLVVFGLTDQAHAAVSQQFEKRTTVSKTYVALVAGHLHDDEGRVDMPIGKVQTLEGFHRWATNTTTTEGESLLIKNAREAITHWKVRERFTSGKPNNAATWTRVELTPLTGRGHQLRLHMKAMGHPLLGDTLHAPPAVAYCAPRLCLHAHRLQVEGGSKGQRLEAISVVPF